MRAIYILVLRSTYYGTCERNGPGFAILSCVRGRPPGKFILRSREVLRVLKASTSNVRDQDIALQVGRSTRHISRCLVKLEAEGLVARFGHQNRVVVVTEKGLQET